MKKKKNNNIKKKNSNISSATKSKKLEHDFLKTNVGKAMFVVLTVGIIAIIIGFCIALFEVFLYLTNIDIEEYSFLISLGIASVITGLVCNILYAIVYTRYKTKK